MAICHSILKYNLSFHHSSELTEYCYLKKW